jgi:cell division septation protein DedD
MSDQDTEFILTTGKLITLFLGLVIVCALFFGFGYTLGRGSSPKPGGSIVADMQAQAAANTKPQAAQDTPKSADCPAGQICPPATPQDMTFYKSVESKDANAQLTPVVPAQTQPAAAQPVTKDPQTQPPTTDASNPGAKVGMGYMVQVAAVSKREDAELLKTALEAKSYPVVITSAASDKLFHVQVGPSSDIKEAESWRAKLIADGYNPLLKK